MDDMRRDGLLASQANALRVGPSSAAIAGRATRLPRPVYAPQHYYSWRRLAYDAMPNPAPPLHSTALSQPCAVWCCMITASFCHSFETGARVQALAIG